MKILLINKNNPLPPNYMPKLAEVQNGYMLEKNAACCMKRMICAAREDGIHLRVYSAYRSINYQKGLFQQDIKRYMDQGMTYDEAYKITSQSIAIPGESEHNAGLAADISTMEWEGEINESFENTAEFRWLSKNACCYGFILRYPRGKEEITNITYEPWHYRFVGCPHAKYISQHNITLEEYLKLHNCEQIVNKY